MYNPVKIPDGLRNKGGMSHLYFLLLPYSPSLGLYQSGVYRLWPLLGFYEGVVGVD